MGLPAEAYGYDKLGNRLSDRRKPDPAQTGERWQYNADNQLIESATENSALLGSNSLPVTHDYDASGSLIRKRTPAGTEASHPYDNQRFVYDAQNRLTEVQDPAGHPIASYQYDPEGRRIRKTVHRQWNGGAWESLAEARTATYVYGEEGLIAEYQAQGNNAAQLAAQYGWQPQGVWGTDPVWIKTVPAGGNQMGYFYYQNDHLGTPQKIIDGQGQSVWSQKATAFGETTVDAAATISNNLRFPGQYFDLETETQYNFFRDYDPAIGRYVESDPIGLDGGINEYAYAGNNPLSNVDPTGEIPLIHLLPPPAPALSCPPPCPSCQPHPAGVMFNKVTHYQSHSPDPMKGTHGCLQKTGSPVHWHYDVMRQDLQTCQCFHAKHEFGGCGVAPP